jgi:hypothetical protein
MCSTHDPDIIRATLHLLIAMACAHEIRTLRTGGTA